MSELRNLMLITATILGGPLDGAELFFRCTPADYREAEADLRRIGVDDSDNHHYRVLEFNRRGHHMTLVPEKTKPQFL